MTCGAGQAPRRWRGAMVVAAASAAVAALAIPSGQGLERAAAQAPPPPNVVVVMTDDQDAKSIKVMDQVNRLLVDRGTSFTNAYATTPLCCPSRATFLTGEYAHNHGVHDDGGGFVQFQDAGTALPVELDTAGYRTGLVGKYLNGYKSEHPVPPGWDVWHAAVNRAVTAYEYDLMDASGGTTHYGSAPADYRTDVYADKAVAFVRRSHRVGTPFFLTVTPGAPHEEDGRPPQPAPRHARAFEGEPLPRPPSYNEADLSDKPSFVQDKPLITSARRAELRERHQGRLASLLAVDDLVKRLVRTLNRTKELSNTVVVFTSDNGYLLGQHRLVRKRWLYEESARVPLIFRGPGFLPDTTRDQVVGNLDLAPTILDLAGATAIGSVDGGSLLAVAADPEAEADRDVLLENFSEQRGGSEAVVAPVDDRLFVYAEHPTGEQELYDLEEDPHQLDSRHGDPLLADAQDALQTRLETLRACADESCR